MLAGVFAEAKGMTDKLAAFSYLCNMPDSKEAHGLEVVCRHA